MKMISKNAVKVIAVWMTVILVLNLSGISACAADDSQKNVSSGKEEVVYAILDSDGTVTGVYVVNIFTGAKEILDYGDYESVRNMTTTDPVIQDGETITVKTSAQKLYYQGNLKTTDIPWDIDIHYYLDGKEYQAADLAGRSGAFKMTMDISKNDRCPENFWEGYALQISMSLDSNLCENIKAEDATIANVGSDKQISYIVLPNKGKKLEITADVSDFEMGEISINGLKLNLNMDVDTEEITDKLEEIQDAAKQLNDGAGELNHGADNLSKGAKSIYDGSRTLNQGAKDLDQGIKKMNTGMEKIKSALETVDGKSQSLTTGSNQILSALTSIQTSLADIKINTADMKKLGKASTQVKTGISDLVTGLNTMDSSIGTYNSTINASLQSAGMNSVNDLAAMNQQMAATLLQTNPELAALLQANAAYITASNTVITGIDSQLDAQTGALMMGANSLKANYETLDTNIQNLVTSLESMASNLATLKSGIDKLVKQDKTFDAGVKDYTSAVSKINEGYKEIYDGAMTLSKGAKNLYEGTDSLVDGALELYQGSSTLKDGTRELENGTSEFEQQANEIDADEKIQDTMDTLTGKKVDVVSFVSQRNHNVTSVLFVLKVPAIEKEIKTTTQTEEPKQKNAFDKFKDLFHK
ncbi:MAG: hypothetical protein ACI4EK_04720 [Wujia sp.]